MFPLPSRPKLRWRLPLQRPFAAALLALLGGCGGGGGTTTAAEPPAARNDAALAPARSGELLGYVKTRLQARGPLGSVGNAANTGNNSGFVLSAGPAWLSSAVSASGTVVSNSGSVVQEAGVDEADLLKTDGTRFYALHAMAGAAAGQPFARLDLYRRDAAGRAQAAGSATLVNGDAAWTATRGLLLADGLARVAVVAESNANVVGSPCPPGSACLTTLLPYVPVAPKVHLQLLDASQPAALPKPDRISIDGRLVGARQIGRMLYVVASHTPALAYDQLAPTASAAARAEALQRLTLAEVLPRISINDGEAVPLVAETDCWLQTANASQQVVLTTVTAIDLGAPAWPRSSRCFAGGTEAIYLAAGGSLYLATTRDEVQTLSDGRLRFAPTARTDLHKLGVDGSAIAYRASGSVGGHLGWDPARRPYRLSEHNGDLRVLSFTGSEGWASVDDAATLAASPATLTVLRERTSGASDASLQPLATLPSAQRPAAIGKAGEQVYGVRFAGERAYVVTFRRTDPLYVLDLSDPADPRVGGELQVSGFSDWLYPLDGGLLFGVGRDASADGRVLGVKLALFDVQDAAQPRLLDSRTHGGAGSLTALDSSAQGIGLQAVAGGVRIALPMLLVTEGASLPQQQVRRYEVDRATRRLSERPVVELGSGWADIGAVRSLPLGEQLFVLQDDGLQTLDW
ncbi:MAG: beta-propeller domain-containing protein [Proteobacteria bacterium]|nr:beta-propeller domain-containing protein [Pseudomonadota bacterium]